MQDMSATGRVLVNFADKTSSTGGPLHTQMAPTPLCASAGLPVEEISHLVGHRGTTVTELVYRHQPRPVVQTGATIMDQLFARRHEGA